MKILIDGVVFSQQNEDDVACLWRQVVQRLGTRLSDVQLYFLNRLPTPAIPDAVGFKHMFAPPSDFAHSATEDRRLAALCKELDIDLFITTYNTSAGVQVKSLFVAYDMVQELFPSFYRGDAPLLLAKKRAIGMASSYLAIWHCTKSDLSAFYDIPEERIRVVYCGLVPDVCHVRDVNKIQSFRQRYGLQRPYFLVEGPRWLHRNVAVVLQAFGEFQQDAHFDIVCVKGEETLSDGEYQFAKRWGADRLHILGKLSNEDLMIAYSDAVALIHPSLYDGLGISLLRAFACEAPVITSRHSALAEVGGDACLYVDVQSPTEIAHAMVNVQQPQLRSDLIAKGKSRITKFDWETIADRYAEAIRELLNSRYMLAQEIESGRLALDEATKKQARKERVLSLAAMSKQMFKAGNVIGALNGFDEVLGICPRIRGEEFSIDAAIQNCKSPIELIKQLRKKRSYHWAVKFVELKIPKLAEFAKRYLSFLRYLRGEKRRVLLPVRSPLQSIQYARAACLMQLGRLNEAETAVRAGLSLQQEDEECGPSAKANSVINQQDSNNREILS